MRTQVFHGEFESWHDVAREFRAGIPGGYSATTDTENAGAPEEAPRFVFAAYDCPDYEGSALVIVSDDGKAFRVVDGGHCSCFGLEGQWEPSEHTIVEIAHFARAGRGSVFSDHRDAILDWLGAVLSDAQLKDA